MNQIHTVHIYFVFLHFKIIQLLSYMMFKSHHLLFTLCHKVIIFSIVLFYSKKDFERSSEYLTKLVTVNPNHVGGFQQLARVRVDMFMECTDRDQNTGHRKQSLKGVMECYEDAISIMIDVSVRNLLLLCSSSCST